MIVKRRMCPERRRPVAVVVALVMIGMASATGAEVRAQGSGGTSSGVTSGGPSGTPAVRTPEDEARAKSRLPLVDECEFPAPLPTEVQERCKTRKLPPGSGSTAPGRTPQERSGR